MTALLVELAQTASGVIQALWLTIFSQILGDKVSHRREDAFLCRVRRATHQ